MKLLPGNQLIKSKGDTYSDLAANSLTISSSGEISENLLKSSPGLFDVTKKQIRSRVRVRVKKQIHIFLAWRIF
jgi:hypothetical protein